MTTGREKPMKKVSLLGKINYIFDKKQKRQLIGLGIMIFIGGILETLGVSGMIPVVTAILNPDELVNFANKYQFLSDMFLFSCGLKPYGKHYHHTDCRADPDLYY